MSQAHSHPFIQTACLIICRRLLNMRWNTVFCSAKKFSLFYLCHRWPYQCYQINFTCSNKLISTYKYRTWYLLRSYFTSLFHDVGLYTVAIYYAMQSRLIYCRRFHGDAENAKHKNAVKGNSAFGYPIFRTDITFVLNWYWSDWNVELLEPLWETDLNT